MLSARIINIVLRRIRHLPRGLDALRYATNAAAFRIARMRRRPALPHPTSLMLEVTNLCQLRCITCAREYSLGKQMDTGHMDLPSAKRLIDESHIYLDSLALTGLGEPLLYPHLVPLIEHIRARNRGVAIFLSTNALLPNAPAIIGKIAGMVDTIQISTDGIGETFEKIRNKGDYAAFASNLSEITRLCAGQRAQVKLNMVVMEDNAQQIPQLIDLAARLSIHELYLNTWNLVATDKDISVYRYYQSSGYRDAIQRAIAHGNSKNVRIVALKSGIKKGFATCPYPWNSMYITWDGYLAPCCAKPFPKIMNFGNVLSRGLMECMNSAEFRKWRMMARGNKAPEFCVKCHYVQ